MPFELTLYDISGVTNFDLNVISLPSSEIPRSDFELFDLTASEEVGDYCVSGKLRNAGGGLQDYLLIVITVYNNQDKVINLDIYEEPSPGYISGDKTSDFEICAIPLGESVARYELQAWGR